MYYLLITYTLYRGLNMQNILITGARGLLAQDIYEKLRTNTNYHVYMADKNDCDITDISSIKTYISGKRINYIINCAANRNAEEMEEHFSSAKLITFDGPINLATVAKEIGAS